MLKIDTEVERRYFEWLYRTACGIKIHRGVSYRKIFELLYDIEFNFYIPNDVNRLHDGLDLRYRFSYTTNTDMELIEKSITRPCSVLEMMLALCIRMEETLLNDPRYGNRTIQWFWEMMKSLGLSYMLDECYDEKIATQIIYDFLEHRYDKTGKGGLFYVPNTNEDMSQLEIWIQMNRFAAQFI